MSMAAGKVGTAYAAAATARTPHMGRSTFALSEAMPINEALAAGGPGPQEESVREDQSFGEGGSGQGNWHKGRGHETAPRISSRFANMLTSYEVDRYLFNVQTVMQDRPLVLNFGNASRVYETVFHIIRFEVPRLGSEYNRFH